jgi:putative acetyltransferase
MSHLSFGRNNLNPYCIEFIVEIQLPLPGSRRNGRGFWGMRDPAGSVIVAGVWTDNRASPAWLPALSLVAVTPQDEVIGHVLCTRAHVDETPVLALGPLSVRPDRQRTGVGSALMHAVLGAGDALGEPMVVLIGDPGYYHRFGFRLGSDCGITPPVPGWQPFFQVRTLACYQPTVRGAFRYAEPFDRT